MKKIIYILLLIAAMGLMHYFSTQDGQTSTNQSNAVIEVLDSVRDKVTLKNEKLIKINENIKGRLKRYTKSIVVRKAAHFSMYVVIGSITMIVVYSFSKKVILSASLSFVFSVLYAVFDERSQIAIDGRSGNLVDVFIDGGGAFIAITILSILFFMGKILKKFIVKNKID